MTAQSCRKDPVRAGYHLSSGGLPSVPGTVHQCPKNQRVVLRLGYYLGKLP